MTLEKAIKHNRDISDMNRKKFEKMRDRQNHIEAYRYFKYAKEHEQLAEWLEELKVYREVET